MILRNFFLFFVLYVSLPIYAFDVRVLLDQQPVKTGKSWIIKAAHGFVSSQTNRLLGGRYIQDTQLKIRATKQGICVNGKQTYQKQLRIDPLLSPADQKQVKKFVEQAWKTIQRSSDFALKYKALQPLFDAFIDSKKEQELDYTVLYTVIYYIFVKELELFYEQIADEPVISMQKLKKNAASFLKDKVKVEFLASMSQQNLSRKARRKLRRSTKYAAHFFKQVVHTMASKLLQDFFDTLPQKILRQFLRHEVGYISYDDGTYVGSFLFKMQEHNASVLCINELDIDDYVVGVVRSEGWPGWPLEANKVIAITVRTYLVSKILAANKAGRPYHIGNTNKHQTYNGHHTYKKLWQAVKETKDLFIAYKDKPIDAMFDSCCGGVIPALVTGINFEKHPYLKRTKACTYCRKTFLYRWKADYMLPDIARAIKALFPKIRTITDIKIVKKDKAGVVHKIMIKTPRKTVYLSGKKMYALFDKIKSFCFSIKKRGKSVAFFGRGYGHHIGLCQWGAMSMVQQHLDYRRILSFYYPHTKIMKLSYQR